MNTELKQSWISGKNWVRSLVIAGCFLGLTRAVAQPTIISTVPSNASTGVSTSAGVVFTFSTAMDTTATTAEFIEESPPYSMPTTTPVWSAGNTVLTCTPVPAFPVSTPIIWVVSGQDVDGDTLGGIPEGTFTTGTSTNGGGGVSTGFGTNKYTSFVVGKAVIYDQLSAGSPTLDTNDAYEAISSVVLASNITATAATVTLPNTTVSSLSHNPVVPNQFFLFSMFTNQSDLDAAFGPGTYGFALTGGNTNLQVTDNLPASWTQPNAPQIVNFATTQSVDPTQPVTLQWNAFSGGTAKDFIGIDVGDNFSALPLSSNTLSGTATSVVIPANTFGAGSNYNGTIAFLHVTGTTNVAGVYTVGSYLETVTQFTLITTNGGGGVIPMSPTLASPTLSGHTISFSVNGGANQNVTIQFNVDGLTPGGWQTLTTTNSGSGVIQVSDAINTANKSVFYRALIAP